MSKVRSATDTIGELALYYTAAITLATIGYAYFEHKPMWDSLWWSIITAMTVGYGDQYPVTVGGRVVGIALVTFTVLFIIPLLTARLATHLIVTNDAFTHDEQEQIKEDVKVIRAWVDFQVSQKATVATHD